MHALEALCKELGMTRYQLAKKSGVQESTISSIIRRNSSIDRMTVGSLSKIASAIGVSQDELYQKLLKYEKESSS